MADGFTLDVSELTSYAEALGEVAEVGARSFAGTARTYQRLVIKEAKRIVPVRTGRLRRSIAPVRLAQSAPRWQVDIVATAPYAGFVEFGTSRMAPRPFLRPALNRYRRDYVEALAKEAKDKLGVTKRLTRETLSVLDRFGET